MKNYLNEICELSKSTNMTLVERALKLSEECGEVAESALSYTQTAACDYKGKTKLDLLIELIDVMIVAESTFYQVLDYDMVKGERVKENITQEKLNKWREKVNN